MKPTRLGLPGRRWPIIFLKTANSVIDPGTMCRSRAAAARRDWEVDVGVVIRRRTEAAMREHGVRDWQIWRDGR